MNKTYTINNEEGKMEEWPSPELAQEPNDLLDESIEFGAAETPVDSTHIDMAGDANTLRGELGNSHVEVLPEKIPAEEPPLGPEDAHEMMETLEQNSPSIPVASQENPIEAEIGEIREKIERAAAEIEQGAYTDAQKTELGLVLKTLTERLVEIMKQRESVPETETRNELNTLAEESKTLGTPEWVSRFITREDAITQEPTQQETRDSKNIAGATYKTLEDLRLPIGRMIDPQQKRQRTEEFFALGARMLEVVNAGKNPLPPEKIEQLSKDVEVLKQKVDTYAQTEALVSPEENATKQKEEEIKTEIEAISQLQALPPEQSRGLWKNIADFGFTVEKKKNEFFAWAFGSMAGEEKTHSRDETLKRFFASTRDIFERDAKRAEQSRSDLRGGKEARLRIFGKDITDITTLRGSGFLWGNLMKYGRSILGPFAWANTGLMTASVGLEAAKEARLENEEVIEKTRIQHIDEAAKEAWRLYEEAQNKAGEGNRVTEDALEKTYQENMPKDLLERLAKNPEPGTENGFWQKVFQKDMRSTVEKISRELEKIDANPNLSAEKKDAEKNAYLNNWFSRSQRLKDYDRIVGQNGEIDTLASFARYGEFTAKAAVYGMMADSMRRLGTKLAEVLSSSDGVEILSSLSPIKSTQADEILHTTNPPVINTEQVPNTGGVVFDAPAETQPGEISPSETSAPTTPSTAVVTPENTESTIGQEAVKMPENALPQPPLGFSENHGGTFVPEAVTLSKGTFQMPRGYSVAQALNDLPPEGGTTTVEAITPVAKTAEDLFPRSEFGFSADHPGTFVEEAVKVPEETIPESTGRSAAEMLSPRESAIEKSLAELGQTYTVKSGDNIWNIIKTKLLNNEEFSKLEPRRQNFIIDSLKDKITRMTPAELREIGIKNDPSRIYPGDELKFGRVFNNSEELMKAFNQAEAMKESVEEAVRIESTQPTENTHAPEVSAHQKTAPDARPERLFAPKTIDSPNDWGLRHNEALGYEVEKPSESMGENIVPEANRIDSFSIPTKEVPAHYIDAILQGMHDARPEISDSFYDTKVKDFLASHNNDMRELDRIFHIEGVKTPAYPNAEILNGDIKTYFARVVMEAEGEQQGTHVTDIGSVPETHTAPNIQNFHTTLNTWRILPDDVKNYIVAIDGQVAKNMNDTAWENMRKLPASDVLADAKNSGIIQRVQFLQSIADIEHHHDLKIAGKETLEHYIARLAKELSWLKNPPEIPKNL